MALFHVLILLLPFTIQTLSMSDLPIGWGDRHNAMSEKDLALGGAAAKKFAKNAGAYQDGDFTYKTSEDVRAHYLNHMKTDAPSTGDDTLPLGWANREKEKNILAKQHGVFARNNASVPDASMGKIPASPKETKVAGASGSDNAMAPSPVAPAASSPSPSPQSSAGRDTSRFVYGSNDALFGSIEERQGTRPFGRVLDAGTGVHSLRWLATLRSERHGMTHCTAVTADVGMQTSCQREVDAMGMMDHFHIIRGNWFPNPLDPDETFLPDLDVDGGQLFDTILADYLVGAMDGFSPYAQDLMIPKLCRYLKPGGRLYLVGLQPLPDSVPGDPDATLICRVRQVRDACILLAGHRCYREYPLSWIQRKVDAATNVGSGDSHRLVLLHSSQFPILYTTATVGKQINVGRSKIPIIRRTNPILADGLGIELQNLEQKVRTACNKRPNGKIELGFDYVVTAELM